MDKDSHDGRVDGLQVVGSMKLMDGELLHQCCSHSPYLELSSDLPRQENQIRKTVLYGIRKRSTLRAMLIQGYKIIFNYTCTSTCSCCVWPR